MGVLEVIGSSIVRIGGIKMSTKKMVKIAVVAALYAALTLGLAPISYGEIQFRISEILVLLVIIDPIFAPGLILGCFIANFFSPLGIVDVVFGTTATAISVGLMLKTSKHLFISTLWPVIVNGLIIGIELYYAYSVPLVIGITQVAFGEFVVVSILGYSVFKILISQKKLVSLMKSV